MTRFTQKKAMILDESCRLSFAKILPFRKFFQSIKFKTEFEKEAERRAPDLAFPPRPINVSPPPPPVPPEYQPYSTSSTIPINPYSSWRMVTASATVSGADPEVDAAVNDIIARLKQEERNV